MPSEITSLEFDSGKEITIGQEKLLSSDGLSPVFQVARRDFFDSLVSERNGDYSSEQLALMERVSYLHARMKQKESAGGYSSEQNYSLANRTFLDIVNALHKLDLDREDREKYQRDFMNKVASSVKYAIKDLDPEAQKNVMFLLSKKMEEILNG